jgi:uncharacterized protein (TIGR02453 family)
VAFAGIPLAALDFYEDLEADNSRSFWTAHKHVYEEAVRAPMSALADELERSFGAAKLFRPYRDVRFSKDKTPYKTHQGMYFGESALYLQISASGLLVAGGYYDTSSAQVERYRRAVADDVAGPQLARAVAGLRRKHYEIEGYQLSRVPGGYPKEHPRADLLRHRTLYGSKDVGAPDWLKTPRARTEIAKLLRGTQPLIAWLDTHVGRD